VQIDHIVYATTDLAASVRDLGALFGVAAAPGGRHPVWGTHNALLALGPRVYLEIVGPDPDGPAPAGPRPFAIDGLVTPRLVTWACRGEELPAVVRTARLNGVDLGTVQARSRQRPDGSALSWTMTDPLSDRAGGVVPFFIDWGDSPHPAAAAPTGCRLLGLRAEHPDSKHVGSVLRALGLDIPVTTGAVPRLVASILSPRGTVELR
jgi:hypothetical protein